MTHCSEDEILPLRFTEEFVEMMRSNGNSVEFFTIQGGRHIDIFDDPEIRKQWEKQFTLYIDGMGWGL